MLVLSRKKEQDVLLHCTEGEIRLRILQIKSGGAVRIGIVAPQEVKILRSELDVQINGDSRGRASQPKGKVSDGAVENTSHQARAMVSDKGWRES